MQDVYTIKKVSVQTEAGYIYNFEDLPQILSTNPAYTNNSNM